MVKRRNDSSTHEKSDGQADGAAALVNFILDETGSMDICRDTTISGFNEYVQSLKKEAKQKSILLTLTKFNTEKTEIVYSAVPVESVAPLTRETYVPDHMTPLYDAIGRTIKDVDRRMQDIAEKPAVLVVIMTDGEENSSREYTRDGIVKMIREREGNGWTFVYLAADQDAWLVGQTFGMHQGNTMTYDKGKMQETFDVLACCTGKHFEKLFSHTKAFFEEKDDSGKK